MTNQTASALIEEMREMGFECYLDRAQGAGAVICIYGLTQADSRSWASVCLANAEDARSFILDNTHEDEDDDHEWRLGDLPVTKEHAALIGQERLDL